MSWLNYTLKSSTRSGNPNFTAEARADKRAKLEAERLLKRQKKEDRQRFFRAGISRPTSPLSLSKSGTPSRSLIDVTESLPDIFLIEEDLFQQEIAMAQNFDVQK